MLAFHALDLNLIAQHSLMLKTLLLNVFLPCVRYMPGTRVANLNVTDQIIVLMKVTASAEKNSRYQTCQFYISIVYELEHPRKIL